MLTPRADAADQTSLKFMRGHIDSGDFRSKAALESCICSCRRVSEARARMLRRWGADFGQA